MNLQQADAGLLTNSGAETGDTSGWTVTDPKFEAVTDRANILFSHTGGYFFDGGGDNNDSQMYQDVDVSALVGFIDDGAAWATLNLWMADEGDGGDFPQATLEFYDAGSLLLDSTSTSWVSPGWLVWGEFAIDDYALPAGTRTIRVVLDGHWTGGHTDAYFDDIDLSLSVPEPSTVALLGFGGLGLLVLGIRRGRSKRRVTRLVAVCGNGTRRRFQGGGPRVREAIMGLSPLRVRDPARKPTQARRRRATA